MKTLTHALKSTFLVMLLLLSGVAVASAADDEDDYSFKVSNTTSQAIKKIQVSEDGKKWGFFNIGNGIPAGKTVTLVWDKSTNGSGCEWFFKAIFADKSESEAVKFDFCEDDVELSFD